MSDCLTSDVSLCQRLLRSRKLPRPLTTKNPALCRAGFLISLFQYRRQPGGDAGEDAEQRDFKNHNHRKGSGAGDDVLDGAVFADAFDNEEVHAYGRRDEGQFHINEEHYVEPDGVKAQGFDDRVEHRQGNKDDGNGFQHAAQDEEDDIDANEDDPFIEVAFGDKGHEGLGYLEHGEDVAEEHGAYHDGKNHAGCLDGGAEDGGHVLNGNAAVNEEGNDEGIHRAYSCRFGRGEDAGVDTADDDDRKEKAPDIFAEGFHLFCMGGSCFPRFVPGSKDDVGHEGQGQKGAGHDAGHEELAHGLVGNGAVENHGDGRRDKDAQCAAGGHRPHYQFPVVAALQHFRNGHGTDGNGGGHGGAGNGGENGAGKDGGNAKASGKVAHPFAAQVEEAAPHPSGEHDLAHKDVEGHGSQYIGIQCLKGNHRHLGQGGHIYELDDAQNPCQGQGEGHGHADNQEDNDQQGKSCKNHLLSLLSISEEIT